MDKHVLIIDDVPTNRIVTKAKLGAMGYTSLMSSTGQGCLEIAVNENPALILLNMHLPDMLGIDVLRALRSHYRTKNTPIIAICEGDNRDTCVEALQAGADDVLIRPFDDQLLLARLRNQLRLRQAMLDLTEKDDNPLFSLSEDSQSYAPPGVLAIVSENSETALKLKHQLQPLTHNRIDVLKPSEALYEVEEHIDIYLIDADRAHYPRAQQLLSDLRSRFSSRNAGMCFWMSELSSQNTRMAFDLGANDVIDRSMSLEEISLRLNIVLQRKRKTDVAWHQLQDGLRLSMIDPLTGLFNRRYATAQLAQLSETALQSRHPFAIMIADLDHFKSINDHFGHTVGDSVLIEAGKRLSESLRKGDLLARIGGEEFLIALPSTDLKTAQTIANRLCAQINARPVTQVNQQDVFVSISIGLSVWIPEEESNILDLGNGLFHQIVENADQALLAAKLAGRNTVNTASQTYQNTIL